MSEPRTGSRGVQAIHADITTVAADAVVNAANQHLAGGGGVDGAIHRAAGPSLMAELRERYDRCPTGGAVITGAGRLAARHVIHAVGPRWRDGAHNEPEQLRSAYRTAFALAADHGCASVVCPSISTGIYGYPIAAAAAVAVEEARSALAATDTPLELITFTLFSEADLGVFRQALEAAPPAS